MTKYRARVADIVRIAAEIWDVHPRDITGPARFRFIQAPRQAVYMIAREHGHSYPQIGQRIGGRDHSTVVHGAWACESNAARCPVYARQVEQLRQRASVVAPWGGTRPVEPEETPIPEIACPIKNPDNGHLMQTEMANGTMRLAAALQKAMAA